MRIVSQTYYDQIADLPVVVPNLPVVDSQKVFYLPIYDEYEDDYDIDLIKQPIVGFLSENDFFQKINDSLQPSYYNFTITNGEIHEPTGCDPFPLCFASFELLRNGFKVTNQAQKFEGMENHIGFLELDDDYMWLHKCFQDTNADIQVFSPLDDERKDNEPVYDDYTSQSKNGAEGTMF
jgi:hypothetical protein